MKKIAALIFILFFLSGCSKDKYMYVSNVLGADLREKKSTHAKILTSLPFSFKIKVLKKSKQVTTIKQKPGNWFYVQFKFYQDPHREKIYKGWVRSSDLSPTVPIICTATKISAKKLQKIRSKHPEYKTLAQKIKKPYKGYARIEGGVGYPSEFIPPSLTIHAINLLTGICYKKVGLIYNKRFINGVGYSMKIPAGIYRIYSTYPAGNYPNSPVYFYYKKDHTPKLVSITNNKIYTGIDIAERIK